MSLVRWIFGGELRAAEREPDSARTVAIVCSVAVVAMLLGDRHGIPTEPLIKGGWRFLVHGALVVAVLSWWEKGRWRVLGTALVVVPLLMRFNGGLGFLKAAPIAYVVGPAMGGAAILAMGLPDRHRWGIGIGEWRWWL